MSQQDSEAAGGAPAQAHEEAQQLPAVTIAVIEAVVRQVVGEAEGDFGRAVKDLDDRVKALEAAPPPAAPVPQPEAPAASSWRAPASAEVDPAPLPGVDPMHPAALRRDLDRVLKALWPAG